MSSNSQGVYFTFQSGQNSLSRGERSVGVVLINTNITSVLGQKYENVLYSKLLLAKVNEYRLKDLKL